MKKYFVLGLMVLIILIGGAFLLVSSNNSSTSVLGAVSVFSNLTPNQFNEVISSREFTLIDIRTKDEYNAGHIAGSKQNDFYQTVNFSKFLDSLDKNGKYLIYCRTGKRSGLTLGLMQQKGFKTVYDLAGGYNGWIRAGFPTE
jgi:phage shock protein E